LDQVVTRRSSGERGSTPSDGAAALNNDVGTHAVLATRGTIADEQERCQFIIAAELQPFVFDAQTSDSKAAANDHRYFRELFRLIDAMILPKVR
jgi:hypothetical protein